VGVKHRQQAVEHYRNACPSERHELCLGSQEKPTLKIVAAVENGISGLPVEDKLALRSQVSQVLQSNCTVVMDRKD